MPEINTLNDIISSADVESTSIIDSSLTLTYGELDRRVSALSQRLASEFGIKPGDRIIMLLPGDWRFVASFYAIIRAGGIAVPVDYRSSTREIEYIAENTGAVLQVIDSSKSGTAPGSVPSAVISVDSMANSGNSSRDFRESADPDEVAAIFFTGGTTGFPKGVPLTHRNILHVLMSLSSAWGLKQGREVFIQFLPMTHTGGFNCSLNTSLLNGGKTILMPRFDPSALLDHIQEQKATVIVGVPTIYSSLVKNTDLSSYDLSSIRVFFSSGAKLQENVQEEFLRKTGKVITVGWGLTESSPQLTVSPLGVYEENYVGKPLPGTEIVAVDSLGNVLPEGETGTLAARGPQVMSGYWKNDEKNLTVFTSEGYLITGDSGYVGKNGVYLLGRTKDVIISGGYKIWRHEVENALMEHECVREVAVVGIKDPMYGESVKAFVVPRCETTREDLAAFCKSRISAYKVPRIVEFRSELPKSSIGKILHRMLEGEEDMGSVPG